MIGVFVATKNEEREILSLYVKFVSWSTNTFNFVFNHEKSDKLCNSFNEKKW